MIDELEQQYKSNIRMLFFYVCLDVLIQWACPITVLGIQSKYLTILTAGALTVVLFKDIIKYRRYVKRQNWMEK